MMNKKGLFALMGMLAVAACIAVSVLAQPTPLVNVAAANEETVIFDTGPSSNPYPSIAGTHKGTITPAKTLNVSKIFTYPCKGTGGHSEYVAFYDESGNEIRDASWDGYRGDYHNIRFDVPLTLYKGVVYSYEIRIGSYPQIIHNQTLESEYGTINCTSFVDANVRSYNDWIPAIRLIGDFVDEDGNRVRNLNTSKNFSTIQAAIEDNETQDNHTIEVYAGTYRENVVVTKRLTLQGIGMPTVDVNGSGSAITISADGCVVDGFKVTGGLAEWASGIMATSNGSTFSNNTAFNNYCGICLWGSSNNSLVNNIVHTNKYGIHMLGLPWQAPCYYNTLADNAVTNNQWGIMLGYSSHNKFTNNIVSYNKDGIYVYLSLSNVITNNTVSSNSQYGILFGDASENRIYHNNFENNTIQAREGNHPYIRGNLWDNGSTEGGNYWSDHECSGNPSGGSQPYYIPGGGIDYYPFETKGGWER